MYKQIKDATSNKIVCVELVDTQTFIPFDPSNTDYQKFKADVLTGTELQDADGNAMTQEAATSFISELP